MYETYLQNEREFDEEFTSSSDFCSCMEGDMYDQFPDGIKALKSHNRLSRIKEMKAFEKELEVEQGKDTTWEGNSETLGEEVGRKILESGIDGYQQGLQLSLDKIREFIKLLEKEV